MTRQPHEKAVTVTSGGALDLSKIRTGGWACVAYTSEGAHANRNRTGCPQRFGTYLDTNNVGKLKTWEIAYDDIDTLVVAKHRRDIEVTINSMQAVERLQEKIPDYVSMRLQSQKGVSWADWSR